MIKKIKECYKAYSFKILWLLLSIYAGYSVCYLLNIAGFANQVDGLGFTQSALSVFVFLTVGYFLRLILLEYKTISEVQIKKKRFIFSLLFGLALGLSFIWGYEIRMDGMTPPGYMAKLWDLVVALGLGVAFLPLTSKWFALLDKKTITKHQVELSKRDKQKMFWYSFLAIIVCWIPVFLAYYPAIMSYDFHRQSAEAYKGYIWFNDHHPLVHTFLIRVFLLLGEAIGSYEIGMAIFSMVQMLILAAVLAYSCNVVGRSTGRKWVVKVMVLVYGILPVHPVLAMSMTKDILFTAFFLLLILLIWERRRNGGLFGAILAVGILTMLLRNNAVYAFAVFGVFYVIISAGERLRIAILCAAIIVGGLSCKTGIREIMNAGSGSSSEMFSVIMQQFARVGKNQNTGLTEEEWNIIDKYVPSEYWVDYNPPLADTIKGRVAALNYDCWEEDIPQMLKDWMKIGIHYPNEYIDAFLALTSGFWFLDDVSHAEVLSYGADTDLGLLYTFNASNKEVFEGVESRSLLPGVLECYQEIVNGNCYYEWPVLSILFKPAFYCWLLLLAMVSMWYKKENDKQIVTLLPFLYLMTMFLGPVVNFRYVYPIIVVSPILFSELFRTE